VAAYVPTREDFFEKKVVGSRIGFLHIIYTSLAICGVLPTVHWVYLHGGLENEHVASWLIDIVVLYTLVAAAFFFYVTLFPERLCPGKFDLVGCSHQWWHMLVLVAMIYWQRSGIELLSFYRMNVSSCENTITNAIRNTSSIKITNDN
ncbi:hypothetical protein OESDEN_24306, partial [Oesophagostomum dentatum]